MAKRIVLACQDVPGWGGASTVNYALCERLQRDGFEALCINLVSESDEQRYRALFGDAYGNPKQLPDVYTLKLPAPLWQAQPALGSLIERLKPDCLLGFGFVAAWLLSRAAPGFPLIFHTSGSAQLKRLLAQGMIRDFIGFTQQARLGVRFPMRAADPEGQVTQSARVVLVHSPLVRSAFEYFFPESAGKLYARDLWVTDLVETEAAAYSGYRRSFVDRDIDVLFVANDWGRPEKNFPLVRQIAHRLAGLRVQVVGSTPRRDVPAVLHGPMTDRDRLFALLGRTRVLVCPSLLDAAPGVLFEAAAMGCNLVASGNCGNFSLCHPDLLAETCRAGPFLRAIGRALDGPFPQDPTPFLGGYADLADTLRVL